MSTFTKEQLIEKLQHRISVASGFPESEKAQMDLELARIALASLEAEAVGEVVLGEYDDCGCHPDAMVACISADGQADWENFKDGTLLFTATPAFAVNAEPVSFDELRDAVAEVSGAPAMEWSDIYKGHQAVPFINFNSLARIVDKFRTAPQAPVSVLDEKQSRELFENWCSVNIERNKWHPEYYAHYPATGQWRAWEACRAAMLQGVVYAETPTTMQTAPALDSSPKIAELPSGNSPVIPDGWVMVPEDPTHEMLEAGDEQFGTYDVYRRMIEAAPKLE